MGANLESIFERVRALYRAHESHCVLLVDEPGRYQLATHEVRAKDGYRTHFGGVEMKKNYVSAHLMPVYAHPDPLKRIARPRSRVQMEPDRPYSESLASRTASSSSSNARTDTTGPKISSRQCRSAPVWDSRTVGGYQKPGPDGQEPRNATSESST